MRSLRMIQHADGGVYYWRGQRSKKKEHLLDIFRKISSPIHGIYL